MGLKNELASEELIQQTKQDLEMNGIDVHVVSSGHEAKEWVGNTIPQDAEVITMSSVTLDTTGISEMLNKTRSKAIKPKLLSMDRKTQGREMNKLGAAPDWAIGSVHAVTQEGSVFIASNTGSQLSAYVYGSQHVIWIVGTQKIVKNTEEAFTRIYNYVLPLESDRLRKATGIKKSNVNKLLIVNKEIVPHRITLVLVKEVLGF